MDVQLSGAVVSDQYPWLCVSPDGLIATDSVLEIKCPVKQDIDTLISSGKYDVRVDANDNLYLDKSGKNQYYMQVQVTLFCTHRRVCYSFVWFMIKMFVCLLNEMMITCIKLLNRLQPFYFSHMLPRLATDFETDVLKVGCEYTNVISLV